VDGRLAGRARHGWRRTFLKKQKMKFILIASMMLFAGQSPDWKLAKEGDGIRVYLAKAENVDFKQFKVEATIAATPQEIANAVNDLNTNYKWFLNVEQAQLIKRINKDEFVFSQVIQVPFPFDNRQVVQHCKTTYLAGGVIRIDLKEKNDAAPINDDYVRMKVSRGYWILTPTATGTLVEYSFLADPSGSIPAWLTNQFIVDSPFKTIKGLRAYLAKK
jgi:hypothetical protein